MSASGNDRPRIVAHRLTASGGVPNHPCWPLLIYQGAVTIAGIDPAVVFEDLFERNGWPPAWRNGIYPFHHFHCEAHEALGVYSGEVTAQFGGDDGIVVTARAGDVIVLPAGTGHKKISSTGALGIVGAYPGNQQPDMCRPHASNLQRYAATVARVARPQHDPVYGESGPLLAQWHEAGI
jgi:uncharacterized protein YjlB